MDGYCACGVDNHFTSCDEVCDNHVMSINGWVEITPDNEEEVYDVPPERLVTANITNGLVFYSSYNDMSISIATMAKYGGYYYYVLPELKIE
jgi:hypothetical protein